MIKYAVLFMLFVSTNAHAWCTKGGYDGNDLSMGGCSSIGEYGNLYYDRDEHDVVTKKHDDESVKKKVTQFFNERFKNHGVILDEKSFKVKGESIFFDILEQNGDKILTYELDRKTGIPVLEKKLVESKKEKMSKDQINRQKRQERLKQLKQLSAELNASVVKQKEQK